jgi:hypothetical protein
MTQQTKMTPKENALELVDRMYQSTKWGEEEDYSPLLQYQRVKKYAIISAEEILKYSISHGFIGLSEYYQEIINEIKKL